MLKREKSVKKTCNCACHEEPMGFLDILGLVFIVTTLLLFVLLVFVLVS